GPTPGSVGPRLEMWPRARYGDWWGGEAMRVETQLSAFLNNRAGVLAELAADLARHGISIRALTVANLVDHSVVRLVVSEPQKALHLLGDHGVLAVSSSVLALDMPDEVLDQVAGAVDHEGRGVGRHAVAGPDLALGVEEHGEREVHALDERGDHPFAVLVLADGEEGEVRVAEPAVEPLHGRHLLDA